MVAEFQEPYNPDKIKAEQRADLIELILYLENNTSYSRNVPTELDENHAHQFYLDQNNILNKRVHTTSPEDPEHVLVIPTRLRQEILESLHDGVLGGHFGTDKSIKKISHRFWWP